MSGATYDGALVERAKALYVPGVFGAKRISDELGVPESTIRRWVNPEVAERGRAASRRAKERYRGVCETCGGATWGDGPGRGRTECNSCKAARMHETRHWTQARVIEAIRRYAAEHGRPPTAREWIHGSHGIETDGYPNAVLVQREFGSWAAGIEASGFPRPAIGVYERSQEFRERLSEQLRRPLSHYIDRLAQASSGGLAPSTDRGKGRAIYAALRTRGISWDDACKLAGVTARREARGRRARRSARGA